MLIKSSQVKLALPFITARGKQQPVIGTTLLQHYSECRRKAAETISCIAADIHRAPERTSRSRSYSCHTAPSSATRSSHKKSDSRKRETDCAVIETV